MLTEKRNEQLKKAHIWLKILIFKIFLRRSLLLKDGNSPKTMLSKLMLEMK